MIWFLTLPRLMLWGNNDHSCEVSQLTSLHPYALTHCERSVCEAKNRQAGSLLAAGYLARLLAVTPQQQSAPLW